ncbi:MAG: response regulator [bacterium]
MPSRDLTDSTPLSVSSVRAVVIDPSHTELAIVKRALLSTRRIEIVAETTSYSLAPVLVERHKPNFAFVSIDENSSSGSDLISAIRRKFRSTRIIAIGTGLNAEAILRCFRSGADEYLVKPLHSEQLAPVLQGLQERLPILSEDNTRQGRTIAFWGSRGGCGTTAVACNIACTLAKTHPTVLADFHFDQGDLAVHLDLRPSFSLRDIGENPDQLDETLIESVTAKHPSGLHALVHSFDAQPMRLSDDTTAKILQILEKRYAYVILDMGHDDSVVAATANYINELYLIVTQDVPSLYLAARKLRLLVASGYERNQTRVLVNQFTRGESISLDRVAKALGKPEIVCVRKHDASVRAAMNQGIPLHEVSRRGKVQRDLGRLAAIIQGKESISKVPIEKTHTTHHRMPHEVCWQQELSVPIAGE